MYKHKLSHHLFFVLQDLRVLALICKPSGNQHFKPFMNSLYRLFSADRSLLQTKGAYIIRQLSVYLSPVDIYRSMAELIQNEEDLKFARLYVEYLNTIMFTAKELQSLRESIKMLETPVSKNTEYKIQESKWQCYYDPACKNTNFLFFTWPSESRFVNR